MAGGSIGLYEAWGVPTWRSLGGGMLTLKSKVAMTYCGPIQEFKLP